MCEPRRHPNPKMEPLGFKSLTVLAQHLREHAYAYTFDDGALVADLLAAANYLQAMAEHD